MAYETPQGKQIKKVAIEVWKLEALFSKLVESGNISFELLGKIDSLENEIVENSEILDLEG
ncbi:Cys/Met metabolism pyridoxal-phosphate-dependent enzyme [Oceanobacillus picturae]|uniref:Cys/Met metabolism pyridoxal-phosphate-dependent enzyme n=1 Tax=Oceanobacillus picturae TaxID=171693 RepID=A0A0U9HA21_9BACI|nr:hypothetical protein [Oceanobacillus picturae]GAQ19490.1 Cys/Met metabolism pyridoxal-phosphate-dependent enzyme [Oceanobacillus picturae]